MNGHGRTSAIHWFAIVLASCAGPQKPTGERSAVALPPYLVTANFTSLKWPTNSKVEIARIRSGVPLEATEQNGRLVVTVRSAIEVRGAMALDEAAVTVCKEGPLVAPYYAGAGNRLRLRSGVSNGAIKVAGTVTLREKAYEEKVPFPLQFRRIAFETELEVARLCREPPPKRHAGTKEDPERLWGFGEPDVEDFAAGAERLILEKDATVELLDSPSGKPLHTFPASGLASTVVQLKVEGEWALVAAGAGPYLTGWVRSRAPEGRQTKADGLLLGGLGTRLPGPFTLHGKDEQQWPLHELPAQTQLQRDGVVFATLLKPGFGRVIGPPKGKWSMVLAAVDDDVSVKGYVETAKLGPAVVPPPP